MARPAQDSTRIRTRMMDLAEAQLSASGGRRLVLTDIARDMGMSQPNAHRFFPTKKDLVRALADRWFTGVEQAARAAVDGAATPRDAVRAFVLAVLRTKRDRYDADPQLFMAYLSLAGDHGDVVQAHVGRLSGILRGPVAQLVAPHDPDAALALIEDATVLFRVPHMIAAQRARATDARALAVTDAVLATLGD